MYIPAWHNINTDLKAASVFLRHIQRGQYLFQDSFYQPVKTICISPYGNKQSMRMLGNASLKCWKRAITLTFQDQNLVLLTISKTLYGFKQARKFWGIPNSNLLGLTKHILVKYPKSKRSIPPSKRVWSNCQNMHAKLWGVFAVSKLFDKAFYVIKDNYSLKLPLQTSDTIYESLYGNKQASTVLRNSQFQNFNG